MPSMRNASDRAAILTRLDRLTPDATARWGRMTPTQMLTHVADAVRMALGDLPVQAKSVPIAQTWLARKLFIYVIPFPKNAPTAKELIARRSDHFEQEREQLRVLVARLDPASGAGRAARHPIFGAMTEGDWGALGYKHFDHHLRQFGV
jgi:Protein of unknown function (DUF1569)